MNMEGDWQGRLYNFAVLDYRVCDNLHIPARIRLVDPANARKVSKKLEPERYSISFNLPATFYPILLTSDILDKTMFKKTGEGIYSVNTDTGIPIVLGLMDDHCLFRFGRVEEKFKSFNELQYLISTLYSVSYKWYKVKDVFPDCMFCDILLNGETEIGYERQRLGRTVE